MALAAKASCDPAGLIAFFRKLAEARGDRPFWLSIDPSIRVRSEGIRNLIRPD